MFEGEHLPVVWHDSQGEGGVERGEVIAKGVEIHQCGPTGGVGKHNQAQLIVQFDPKAIIGWLVVGSMASCNGVNPPSMVHR
jgi:hypothetical protein